jgi:hypothetical protein
MTTISVIVGSTRQGRFSEKPAQWILQHLQKRDGIEASRREIAACLRQLRNLYPDVAFAPNDTTVLIETPDKTLAEYVTHMTAASTGRLLHQLFTGYLVAEAGEIKLLRESFNPLAMAQAQLPTGVAAIGPPSNEVHSF